MKSAFIGLSTAAALLCGVAAAAEPAKSAKSDEQLDALRAEVRKLRDELEALKTAPVPAAAPVPASASVTSGTRALEERVDLVEIKQQDAVVMGDLPGSFRVPGTEVSLRLYGFAELNWVHDFKGDNSDIDYSTFAPYMPLDGTPEGRRDNRDYLTARTSRIGLEAATPTRYGVLGIKIEGDFNNEPRTGDTAQYGTGRNVVTQQATSSYGLRVRHLYGTFGGLLVGQTWSTFMDVDNYPETVDYNGPVGATFIRQPVIRYAYGAGSAGTFTGALENSSSYVLADDGSVISTSLSRIPDLVLRWDRGFEWGALSVRGMTQELRIDDGDADASKRGWGLAASGLLKVRSSDLFTLQVTGGDGIGRYLNYIEGAFYDAGADALRLERAVGVIAGYTLKPMDRLRINLVYGMTRSFENGYTDFAAANGLDGGRFGVNRWVQQAHIGPIFTVVPGVDLGLEGIWAQRQTYADEKGEMVRLNFSVKYYLN
jgi:hypothetical protein